MKVNDESKMIQDDAKRLTLNFVTVPFSGHFKILAKLAKELKQLDAELEINFIITGWNNVTISAEDATSLTRSQIKIIELSCDDIRDSQPMAFTFPRVESLTDEVIAACENSDYIVYDFFSLEGCLAAKKLNIPAICSVPAIMGEFDRDNPIYQKGIAENLKAIMRLEKKYNLEIASKLEMVSDGFYLPSDRLNIQWSWQKFIAASGFEKGRSQHSYLFMRPKKPSDENNNDLIDYLQQIKNKKKIIYISLGTVVTRNLWENVPECRKFVKDVFKQITQSLAGCDEFEVVVATGRNPNDLFDEVPANFHIFESVPQQAVLEFADVFVTHGGGNSVNEAIDARVPMVVVPFFGDQHLCAENVEKSKVGISFFVDDKRSMVDTKTGNFYRKSLDSKTAIADAIEKILSDVRYRQNMARLHAEQPSDAEKLLNILQNEAVLDWQEGDLLYGCNDDRKKLAEITGRIGFFKLCDERPFTKLFSNSNDRAMPRIVDQYHDVLADIKCTVSELSCVRFQNYRKMLIAYQKQITHQLDRLSAHKKSSKTYNQILWGMCLDGLSFFTSRKHTVHFIVGKYNEEINLATRKELNWLKKNWSNKVLRQHVKFYVVKNGLLSRVNPEQYDWFRTRPTPSLEDVISTKPQKHLWKKLMSDIKETRKLNI